MTDGFAGAEDDQTAESSSNDHSDVAQHLEAFNSDGVLKEKTIGIALIEGMYAFYHGMQSADDVNSDPTQSIWNHLEKLAHRYPWVFEKAMGKLEIERVF